MIDIHSHVLPMVDDGSQSVRESLMMLKKAYQDGTDALVLTPHLAYPYGFVNPYDKISGLFEEFRYIAEQEHIPVRMYLGCEFLFDSPESFIRHLPDITKINGTQYILIEFFFDIEKADVLKAVDTVISCGFIPVIAHPERYECMQISADLASQCILRGALLQMNKGSLFGQYGTYAKETVAYLLEHRCISFIGSDAHNLSSRNTLMYEDYCCIRELYGSYADEIFRENPKMMLENQDIRKVIK